MRTIEVFNYTDMPPDLSTRFLEETECNNEFYIRWYRESTYLPQDFIEDVNYWLYSQGAKPFFDYVLIYVSW